MTILYSYFQEETPCPPFKKNHTVNISWLLFLIPYLYTELPSFQSSPSHLNPYTHPIMNNITRNATLRRMNRGITSYEHLDKSTKPSGRWRAFSTRRTTRLSILKTQDYDTTMSPVHERRDRARRRHIFLQGYELSKYATKEKLRSQIKLKKAMVKVKRMVVSVLSYVWVASLNKCNSKSAINVSSAAHIRRCFWIFQHIYILYKCHRILIKFKKCSN